MKYQVLRPVTVGHQRIESGTVEMSEKAAAAHVALGKLKPVEDTAADDKPAGKKASK